VRLLFLDFDGVLNSLAWAERRPTKEEFAASRGISPEVYQHNVVTWAVRSIDPAAVDALNAIVDRSRARIVVSSTWRTMYALPKLEWILRECGLRHHLLGTTPCQHLAPIRERGDRRIERGEEIARWLEVLDVPVPLENIVILDDDADMAHLRPRLFQTDPLVGLLAEHVDEVVAMFEGQP
jgi:hypothetical protein